jgi:hypothetical protein
LASCAAAGQGLPGGAGRRLLPAPYALVLVARALTGGRRPVDGTRPTRSVARPQRRRLALSRAANAPALPAAAWEPHARRAHRHIAGGMAYALQRLLAPVVACGPSGTCHGHESIKSTLPAGGDPDLSARSAPSTSSISL